MNQELLISACEKLRWKYTVTGNELTVFQLNSNGNLRGEYAMKIVGNKVTYNTYYLQNAQRKVQELQNTFYELNVKYAEESIIREFKIQGWTFKSNDKFKANENEKVSFYMVGRSKLKEETEPVSQIKFTILKDGSVKTDSDYIPKDIHELADKAMESLEGVFGSKREVNGKEIPLKYKHKTFCENKKTISITKK
ncbi:hypothetical protein [Leeuwenhoekiella sp. MAR_2009_132]|uniref:hypothetical protein n=1 Tax=Leeuwenhoekiella sp. MAR_2009_132 TaxID=1392489 RepID=UPI00190179BD|nr:hypothetical protein [Leeuwenhoekiella sp. MAR_2009_132]